MNTFRLFQYFVPKKFLKELLLILQVALMALYAMAVMSPLDTYYKQWLDIHRPYKENYSQMLFFNPSNECSSYNDLINQVAREINKFAEISSIIYTVRDEAYFQSGKMVVDEHTNDEEDEYLGANLFLYSNNMFHEIFNAVCVNEFMMQAMSKDTVPILISPSLEGIMQIGTDIELFFAQENRYYTCTIVGILERETYLTATQKFGSFPSFSNIGFSIRSYPEAYFIVAQHDYYKFSNTTGDASFIVHLDSEVDELKWIDSVNSMIGALGRVYSFSEIEALAFTNVLSMNSMYLFEFILLTLVSIFGYGGYLYISVYKEQKKFSVFHILGLSRRRLMLIQCIKGVLSMIISLLIAVLIFPWFQNIVLVEKYTGIGSLSVLYCSVLLAFILMASLLAAFQLTNSATTISIYQKGD